MISFDKDLLTLTLDGETGKFDTNRYLKKLLKNAYYDLDGESGFITIIRNCNFKNFTLEFEAELLDSNVIEIYNSTITQFDTYTGLDGLDVYTLVDSHIGALVIHDLDLDMPFIVNTKNSTVDEYPEDYITFQVTTDFDKIPWMLKQKSLTSKEMKSNDIISQTEFPNFEIFEDEGQRVSVLNLSAGIRVPLLEATLKAIFRYKLSTVLSGEKFQLDLLVQGLKLIKATTKR